MACNLPAACAETTLPSFEKSRGRRIPVKSPTPIPAYQRIQGKLRESIDAGNLKPGDAVPSERELAKIHNVSLMTARHALAFLEQEGLVERRRGVGTFVAAPKIHFNKLTSYTEQMGSRSLTVGSKLLFAKIIDDAQDVNARLALSPKSKVIKLERLRHAAGEPFALETCYLSAAHFPGLLAAPLQREFHVELGYADEEVDATAADSRTAELLAVPKREALLRIRQIIYSTKGAAIMCVLGLYRSNRHNLVIRRFR